MLATKLLVFVVLVLLNWRVVFKHWKASLVYFLGLSCIGLMFWTKRYIGECNADQLLSTLAFGLDGVLAVSWHMLSPLLKWIVIFPLLGTIFFLRVFKEVSVIQKIFPTLLILIGFFLVGQKYDVIGLIRHLYQPQPAGEDLFARHYQNPKAEKFQISTKPKSLILIYVESLEITYQNPQLFDHNLLTELKKIFIVSTNDELTTFFVV